METQSYIIGGTKFEVTAEYRLDKVIGQGAYGVVVSATNLHKSSKVAMKKISKIFESPTDSKRTLREIKLLSHMKHENILTIEDILLPYSYAAFEDIYVVTPLMETDLYHIIHSDQVLTEDHFQYFIYQILRGLKYIHSAGVLHRDLKPGNLLVNANCDLKICDFGLATGEGRTIQTRAFMTEYVATRWYRAPELMLSWSEYTSALDIWSVGCIFAELLGRAPLFPGKNYLHQLDLITDVTGGLPADKIGYICNDKAQQYMISIEQKEGVELRALYPNASPEAIELLRYMLQMDPADRVNCEQALQHPYLHSLHDPNDEPISSQQVNFAWEDQELTGDIVKWYVLQEISVFHPQASEMLPDLHQLQAQAQASIPFQMGEPQAVQAPDVASEPLLIVDD
eukprot:Clim_evm42s146 gene=Clim_evmTU42s146